MDHLTDLEIAAHNWPGLDPGQVACRFHGQQQAVDGYTGKPIRHSDGCCEACWHELQRQGLVAPPPVVESLPSHPRRTGTPERGGLGPLPASGIRDQTPSERLETPAHPPTPGREAGEGHGDHPGVPDGEDESPIAAHPLPGCEPADLSPTTQDERRENAETARLSEQRRKAYARLWTKD